MIDRRTLLGAGLAGLALSGRALAAAPPAQIVRLPHSGGRMTDFRVLFPARPGRLGLLLFSHGSYASNLDYDLMLQPWADAGFLCVAPNHIDANTKSPMPANAMPTRIQDMLMALDQRSVFEDMARKAGSRLGPQTVASGHSAGGGIARTLAGGMQSDGSSTADPRLSCIVCFSPPGPQFGHVPKAQWSTVKVPAFLQTGTADVIKGFDAPWYDHKTGFEDDKGRGRWLAVGANVDHLFGGLICYRADGPAAEAQRPALTDIVDLSATFMKAYAKGEGGALARLKRAADKPADAPAVTFTSV